MAAHDIFGDPDGEPLQLPTDPATVVVLTDAAGKVALTLRFGSTGHEYAGARGGDMDLRGLLLEMFHHRRRAAAQTGEKPFSRAWLRSHLQLHLNAVAPGLRVHPPLFGDHPDLHQLVVGKSLPRSLASIPSS